LDRPIRVLISKIGLDGHDRGAKLIVRNLRDAGMEVIYTGLWQTPAATVQAAVQEDVDVVGVSLHSAAHMTIMPELVRLCQESGIPETPAVVGGIIPEEDRQPLFDAGCRGVFNPGTPTTAILEAIRELAAERREGLRTAGTLPDLKTQVGLARAITMVVEGGGAALSGPLETGQRAYRIGITGSAGVGKSTLIGKLARHLRQRGQRVGVVAIDPSSPISGGTLLGDRLRMMQPIPDDGLFIRSLSSSGISGGLAPHAAEIARLLGAAGYGVVLIETVGAGQGDTEIRLISDEVLLVLMPAAGDAVQFLKGGIVEVVTGFVVNKADIPGADATVRELRDTVQDQRPVWRVSSLRDEGFDELCDWIERHLPGTH
jgi:LAO/AO transport system ATPase